MSVLGLGHDVVDVAAFGEQLAEPGSRMRNLFSVREVRQAVTRARLKNDGEAVHLAARWAGKEAVLKAWCEALGEMPLPYTLDDFPWAGVEILDDSRGVPHVDLRADVEAALRSSLPPVAGGPSSVSVSASEATPTPAAMMAAASAAPAAERMTVSAAASGPIWHISLSHDGPVASAVAMLCSR
ncbi:holo-ACP synthase [Bifidobacterium saguinibicoloris]|uniref:holo-ACP synthase n=1 Tax=Bifidobacterium saguinibicoloris TaxID=2834433 RepID=UPI001C5881E2|nr:4'-phosphopantetheinyl transferase superfamily protein [Bifidobacterium saguinibicoloris]MBW3081241.1 4'-phosphopantetheinyl transferase superfamily protein [Bifidobacterium saguinibicoloris]